MGVAFLSKATLTGGGRGSQFVAFMGLARPLSNKRFSIAFGQGILERLA
jgi:hypothetical protein